MTSEYSSAGPRVAVAILGARGHYAVPRILHRHQALSVLWTDAYSGNKPYLSALLGLIPRRLRPRGLAAWLGRRAADLPSERVRSFDLIGWQSVFSRKRRRTEPKALINREIAQRFNRAIERAGFGSATTLYGMCTASAGLFRLADPAGLQCILEQASAARMVQRELLAAEWTRWPGWQPALLPVDSDLEESIRRDEAEEWGFADRVLAPSAFVIESLRRCGVAEQKIRLVPYGVDLGQFPPPAALPADRGGPLRICFAGSVSLPKGAPYLLEAVDRLGPARAVARFAGSIAIAPQRLRPFGQGVELLGRVPRTAMAALYGWADVFVLPTVLEGSAMVTYEALASGLPVVTTPNAGSIVTDGVNGTIVPTGSSEALYQALLRYHEDRDLLAAHRAGALASRAATGLERYAQDLMAAVLELHQERATGAGGA